LFTKKSQEYVDNINRQKKENKKKEIMKKYKLSNENDIKHKNLI